MKDHSKSQKLYNEAIKYIPGGVNSPVRAFKSVGGNPLFIKSGKGSKIYDVDGNEYIDYVCSWGPLILGHSHPKVVSALNEQSVKGTSYGAPTELEITLAKMVIDAFPAMQMVRMVSSGTEATMSAIRLARGYTGRGKIVKFEGCYHGHGDSFLIKAGSGALTLGVPTSPGVPAEIAEMTIVAKYNDLDGLCDIFDKEGKNISAVIVEPIAANVGLILPKDGYLKGLRDLTKKHGALLIFDEVITGFRVAYGGAQTLYGIEPDLTCLGKIIGGGLPVGAYGGKREIMECMAPVGPIYQAGTLSGNPMAMVAGITTLEELRSDNIYNNLEQKSSHLANGLKESAEKAGVAVSFNRVGSMLCAFFTDKDVVDYDTAISSDTKKYALFFKEMQEQGIYLAPSQFETSFVSLAHTDEDIEKTIKASYTAFNTNFS
jgi:glutamate-1-semialdehyde 2,1-aminomutase